MNIVHKHSAFCLEWIMNHGKTWHFLILSKTLRTLLELREVGHWVCSLTECFPQSRGEGFTGTYWCVYNTDHDVGSNGETLDLGIYPSVSLITCYLRSLLMARQSFYLCSYSRYCHDNDLFYNSELFPFNTSKECSRMPVIYYSSQTADVIKTYCHCTFFTDWKCRAPWQQHHVSEEGMLGQSCSRGSWGEVREPRGEWCVGPPCLTNRRWFTSFWQLR